MILTDELKTIRDLLFKKNSSSCEDCFLGYLVWKDKYGLELKNVAGAHAVFATKSESYLMPFSPSDDAERTVFSAVEELIKNPASRNGRLSIGRVTVAQKDFLEKNFPGRFSFTPERGMADYLYDIDALCSVGGKKLSKKRNHINAFLQMYADWSVREIDESNISEVLDFADSWYNKKSGGDTEIGDVSLGYERNSLFALVPHLEQIGGDALVLYVNGKVAGFTVGQRISETVYDTVFEKADDEIRGAYNMINREFARYLKEKYPLIKFINRENDLDLPGLRQAKLSYNPDHLVEKFMAELV